jgi:putative ABC transport system permease protein
VIRLWLGIVSLLVPAIARPRWREEWQAELNHARSRGRSLRARMTMAGGAVPDALATRRIAALARRAAGPRAGIFHALDQDIRYAVRGLAKDPGFAFGVILSLALGIGANAAAFSVINAAMFRPFPRVANQEELVRLALGTHDNPKFSTIPASYRDFMAIRENMTTISGLSAYRDAPFAISTDGQTSGVPGTLVSGNYFDVLGVTPAAGRFFLDREDRTAWTHPVVVISDALWERLYDRAPSAIGRPLLVNGAALEIVGVAPRDFMGVRTRSPGIWVPMAMGELTLRGPDGRPARAETAGPLWLDYVGRRRSGVTLEQVRAEAGALRERLDATRPDPRARVSVGPVLLNDPSGLAAEIAGFMAVPMLVLAIACVNAANLVMARSSRHVRDWTVRLAVGATRWRVVRQVLADAMILSAAATVLGLVLSRWGLSFIMRILPVPVPLDGRVALFAVAIAVLTAVIFSLGPALSVTRHAAKRLAPAAAQIGGSRARSTTRFALIALQAALSLGLLATGTQFAKTVYAAAATEPIADPESLVLAAVDVDPLRLEREAGEEFYRQLLDRLQRIPGVAAAGFGPRGILTGQVSPDTLARIWVPGSPDDGRSQIAFQVSTRLLEAIAVHRLQGRGFTTADETSLRTVVVNKAFTEKFLQGQSVGRTFRLGRPANFSRGADTVIVTLDRKGMPTYRTSSTSTAGDAVEVTVVGVVDGIMKQGATEPPILYYPAPLVYQPGRTLFLRLDRSGRFNAAALHAAAREIDARVPITGVTTLAEMRLNHNVDVNFAGRAVGVLGILALILTAGGLYSVVSYIVSMRRQEVGIRIALGAGAGSIIGMIVRQALLPTVIGAAAGAGGAAVVGVVIRSRMYGASPVDPVAFGGATLLMLGVMLLASWLPARHAGRVDPISVLRQE